MADPYSVGGKLLQVQEVVGDKLWMDMMQRKADRLYAVLKSLPLTPDASAPSSSDGNQRAVAEALLVQVHPCVWSFVCGGHSGLQGRAREQCLLARCRSPATASRIRSKWLMPFV